ncbi:MAG: hypothetical protein Q9195_000397 [Heterodermia aff. obscurata]
MSAPASNQTMQDEVSSSSESAAAEMSVEPTGTRATVGGPQTGRKRKVLEPVTSNACTNCKRARAKQHECRYEIHTKTAKEQMVREILALQTRTEQLQGRNETLEEENSLVGSIIASLQNDTQGPEIIRRLKQGESNRTIATWLGRPVAHETSSLSPVAERNLDSAIANYHQTLIEDHDPRYWTNVSVDRDLIEHLIRLYFTWVHPVHMFFDEGNFLESFKDCADVYCSSSLVNAILAMSCFLLHTAWRTDSDGRQIEGSQLELTQSAVAFLREQFIAEAKAMMDHISLDKMTSIQTYAVIFLVDVACGRGLEALAHLRVSTEAFTAKRPLEQSSEAEDIVSWGILTAQTRGKVNAQALAGLYERYLSWMENLPVELKIDDSDPLPHVLFLHIQYYTAVVNLLQPLLHLSNHHQVSFNQLLSSLVQYAKIGVDLLFRYKTAYSDHFVTPLQLFCLVHLCDAVVRYDGEGEMTDQAIHFCLSSLEEAKTGYPLAGPLQKMFRVALSEYHLPVPRGLERMMGSTLRMSSEELLKVCSRLTYRVPIGQLLPSMDPDLSRQFVAEWQKFGDRFGSSKGKLKSMDIGTMLNA